MTYHFLIIIRAQFKYTRVPSSMSNNIPHGWTADTIYKNCGHWLRAEWTGAIGQLVIKVADGAPIFDQKSIVLEKVPDIQAADNILTAMAACLDSIGHALRMPQLRNIIPAETPEGHQRFLGQTFVPAPNSKKADSREGSAGWAGGRE